MDDDRIERGVARIRELGQVMPDEADAEVAAIYDDIRRTLGVPFVNSLFRVLANDPAWLGCAWTAFRPHAATPAFAAAAARVRDLAAPQRPPDPPPEAVERDDVEVARRYTAGILHALPRLLLFAAAVTAPREGEPRAPLDRGGRIAGAPDPEIPDVGMAEPDDPQVGTLLAAIAERHGHPAPATWFRGLARRPQLLEWAWSQIEPTLEGPGRSERREGLVDAAEREAAALGLPELLSECPPENPDEVADVLAAFRERMIPDVLLDAALVEQGLERRR